MLYEKIKPYLLDRPIGAYDPDDLAPSLFICVAIAKAYRARKVPRKAKLWLDARIHADLQGLASVVQWLDKEGHLRDIDRLSWKEHVTQIQLYRHRWLKHLCEEYERDLSSNR